MNILNYLTIKHLKLNKKRTIVSIIGIILSTALMVGIGLLFSTMHRYLIISTEKDYGSQHVVINNVDSDKIKNLELEKNIKSYYKTESMGFSYLKDSQNEYKPYLYLLSGDKELFKILNLIEGHYPQNENEIVISEHISLNGKVKINIGDELELDYGVRIIEDEESSNNSFFNEGESLKITGHKKYKVVGIVQRYIHESYSAAGYTVFTLFNEDITDKKVSVFITFNSPKNIYEKTENLAAKLGIYDNEYIDYNSNLLTLYGESKYDNFSSSMTGVIVLMLSIVSVACIIVIYNSFAISVMERKKQFGLFSSIGTTKKQLRKTVLFEALIVGVIGITLGILGAFLGIYIVILLMNELLTSVFDHNLVFAVKLNYIVIPVLFMIGVIFLSALLPAHKASKFSPIETIKQMDDIKLTKRKLKINKLVSKLFGVPGELALKNIKRNKKKYRITIISLVVSIVLFISFGAYLNYAVEGTSSMVGNYNIDFLISNTDLESDNNELFKEIKSRNEIKDYLIYKDYHILTKAIDKKYINKKTPDFIKDRLTNEFIDSALIKLDEKSYNKLVKKYNLKEDSIIIYNKYEYIERGNSRKNHIINILNDKFNNELNFCNSVDDKLDCSGKTFKNVYLMNEDEFGFEIFKNNNSLVILVNGKTFNEIDELTDIYFYNEIMLLKLKNGKNSLNIDKYIDRLINETNNDNYNYSNIKEEIKSARNIVLAVKILFYGFISLVTLIGITSVFNTINTSIALRRKEFAVLRSIGLTSKEFNKMLRFESLFFGIKSLFYGIPISIGIVILISYSFSGLVEFENIMIPWNNIVIAVISIFIVVFICMFYSTNKIKKENILDAIREENI